MLRLSKKNHIIYPSLEAKILQRHFIKIHSTSRDTSPSSEGVNLTVDKKESFGPLAGISSMLQSSGDTLDSRGRILLSSRKMT